MPSSNRVSGLVAASLWLALPALAHTPQQPPHQSFAEGDLKLESGEAIRDSSISYVTTAPSTPTDPTPS